MYDQRSANAPQIWHNHARSTSHDILDGREGFGRKLSHNGQCIVVASNATAQSRQSVALILLKPNNTNATKKGRLIWPNQAAEGPESGIRMPGSTLPLIFASSFMEDVFLAVDREDTVLQRALPAMVSAIGRVRLYGITYHLFFTRCTLSYMQSMI
jgi:hypothetical protein